MRKIATIAFVLATAHAASARGEPPAGAGTAPPPAVSGDASSAATAAELKRRVEQVGFKDVEIVPQMFVVVAKTPDGKEVSLIVDAESMQALQLGGDDQGASRDPGQDQACNAPRRR